MTNLNAIDNESLETKIIKATQNGMPLVERPFLEIADKVGVSEEEVIKAMSEMTEKGLIRRTGAVPNHYAIGYLFNLMTVWDIKDRDADQVGRRVGALDFVSHCYLRPRHLPDWPYNFFAMVHGKSEEEALDKMAQIEKLVAESCDGFTALKSQKILKKTGLRI